MPFNEVLQHYFPTGEWKIEEGQSGWNNTTRFIEAEGKRWVLRIYETHKDADKIHFEHQILQALNELELPYGIPAPATTVSSLSSGRDSTVVQLADGTGRFACVFSYMEGRRPDKRDINIVHVMGRAIGQLSIALNSLKIESKPQYPPYYELDQAHPSCSPVKVSSFCFDVTPAFREHSNELRIIGEAIANIRTNLAQLHELPHQLIHGDINYSNILVSDEADHHLAAILDFEFCTQDLRVMEVAVIVSSFLSSEQPMVDMTAFLSGVGEVLQLEEVEVEALPLLVELRILDVFQHFLGRYLDGVDEIHVLKEQIVSTYESLISFERVKDELREVSMKSLTLT